LERDDNVRSCINATPTLSNCRANTGISVIGLRMGYSFYGDTAPPNGRGSWYYFNPKPTSELTAHHLE
jgi:hypothetical protein